jgi:DNA uptake protein ComE-like DNA-binding protein
MFSRGEKLGIAGLVFLILAVYALPFARERWFPPPLPDLSYADSLWALERFHAGKPDTAQIAATAPDFFDPNTAELSVLLSLGFDKRVAGNLIRYRQKGGRLKRPDDLLRIWGMDTLLYRRIESRIQIPGSPTARSSFTESGSEYPQVLGPAGFSAGQPKAFKPLDVNSVDSQALVALPGIGPATARRILAFREKLGGFHTEQQLMEVYGVDTQRIRGLLASGKFQKASGIYRKIPLATATFELLDAHPYISRNQARVLIAYRQQHKGIRGEPEFRQIAVFSRQEADRILPYLDFGQGQ